MLEMNDGTFGPIEPFQDVLPKFLELVESGEVKALHVGMPKALQARRTVEENIADINKRLDRIESSRPAASDVLHIPTTKEIKLLTGEKTNA